MALKTYLLGSLTVGCFLLQACGAGAPPKSDNTAIQAKPVAQECRNGGDRLPESGMCKDAAINTLNLGSGDAPILPDGCSWQIQESRMAMDILLYMAASCDGKTSKLAIGVGAQQVEMTLEESALGLPTDDDQTPVIRVITSDPDAPYANLEYFTKAAVDDPAEAANCVARPAGLDGWPEDAIVVDIKNPPAEDEDGPRSACGPYGFAGDNTQYWRVFNDFAWFFDLGQDAYQDIDVRSLTLVPAPSDN